MKPHLFFWTLVLVAAFVISSCAPAEVTEAPSMATATTRASTPTAALTSTNDDPGPVSTNTPAIQPLATSRGPDLEATDPTTVNLASGQLELVEFFRFT